MAKMDKEDFNRLATTMDQIIREVVADRLKDLDHRIAYAVRKELREELANEVQDAVRRVVRSRVEVEVRVKE